ncbi:methylated-DNA-[protein]-cysteine S-methyltransferase [Psychrobacter sp. PL19]|uniref:methylated-DNA--[protein]-cysteine S-methyltransferase n=1 Tax=Psychrobacter sp. PL19 TaxID=2760711 RepID=UPI001AE7947A
MIITHVTVPDIAAYHHDNEQLSKAALLLGSHTIDGTAKLVWCKWLGADEHWQDKIKLSSLAKHYNFDIMDTEFVEAEQLVSGCIEQQLLLTSIAQLQQYLQGTRRSFDLPIDTTLGTEFQQKVWRALQKIPYGQTISYAKLADNIGQPTAFRAVANANGKNPFSVTIPCHRVIASDGKLGGYTGGLDKKEYLLALEGITCKA